VTLLGFFSPPEAQFLGDTGPFIEQWDTMGNHSINVRHKVSISKTNADAVMSAIMSVIMQATCF